MNVATHKTPLLPKTDAGYLSRLQAKIDFCAYSEDPVIHVRNAWTQTRSVQETLPIGTSIALEFGDTTLVCSFRAATPTTQKVHARLLPTDIALQEDISLEVWPQWRHAGHASEFFNFKNAIPSLPLRWDFILEGATVVIVPSSQPLSTALGLQISQPFAHEQLLELHPYLGSWVTANTFIDRHPPVYPQLHTDAWGWLLPTAPWNFELEGYRFRSVWEYAINPILRSRKVQRESILERLVRATEYRLKVDDVWRKRAQHHAAMVRYLADKTTTDEKEHVYFLALSKMEIQQ